MPFSEEDKALVKTYTCLKAMGREGYCLEFPGKKLDKGRSRRFAEEAL